MLAATPSSPLRSCRATATRTHPHTRTMASPVQYRVRARTLSNTAASTASLQHGQELDDAFSGLDADGSGLMTVAGFGSLLSERSARTTFPNLIDFRPGRLYGFRRVFAHTADIFFVRGIANPATGEIASLSCEPIGSSSGTIASSTQSRSRSGSTDPQQQLAGSSNEPGNSHDDPSSHSSHYSSSNVDATPKGSSSSSSRNDDQAPPSLVVSLFEVPSTPASVAAFLEREHEFRFLAVQPYDLSGKVAAPRMAVLCGANTDEHYKATRCPPDEWARRWGVHGMDSVWRDDVLPCRVYLRHCVLAARGFCPEAYDSFLDNTYLSDRVTSVRQYLQQHPEIMEEQPPPELVGRYSG